MRSQKTMSVIRRINDNSVFFRTYRFHCSLIFAEMPFLLTGVVLCYVLLQHLYKLLNFYNAQLEFELELLTF